MNQTGLAVQEGDVEGLAEAITKYATSPDLVYEHSRGAKALAELNFNVEKNAQKILDLYNEILN